jgi:RimJ/RimL family protein N-acetyltransferase
METERLLLRRWREGDAEPFAAINADPLVTRYVGGPMTREASDALLARSVAFWDAHGYGRAAVEDRATRELLGFCGLGAHPATAGETEIGWRLAAHAWGRGLATEAATAMRDLAFSRWGLPRLVSVAVPENPASLGVMRNIGMTHWKDVTYDGLLLTVYVGWPP